MDVIGFTIQLSIEEVVALNKCLGGFKTSEFRDKGLSSDQTKSLSGMYHKLSPIVDSYCGCGEEAT